MDPSREFDFTARLMQRMAIGCVALALLAAASAAAAKAPLIQFGVQPWPGVTVKTQVAADILDALGYQTTQRNLNTPFILHGLVSGEVDVALGGWYPISAAMIQPLVDKGKLLRIAANLPHALSGMAVPVYVHQAGVDSIDDLNRFAAHFDHKIYGIEAGSTWNTQVKNVIKANRHDLGGWQLVSSSTAAMLTQVGRAISHKKWIVFYGWKPHWMNIKYKLYYLKAPPDSPIAHTKATVYTLVSAEFPETRPNLARFFRQYTVNTKIQSRWIYGNSYQHQPAAKVAKKWIASHLDIVQKWLQGVTTAAGQPAFPAVQAVYGN